jgi:hypothetical protein
MIEENTMHGKRIWFFPDGERPPEGNSKLKGHESFMFLNPNDKDSNVKLTIYFEDKEPVRDINVKVKANRVLCIKTYDPKYFPENAIPLVTQYAAKVESDIPIIAQYGRLDERQVNLAYYTTMGYPGE